MKTQRKILYKERKILSANQRLQILLKNNFQCSYCKETLTETTHFLDHKIPISRGGNDEVENLTSACGRCDYIKGNATDKEFLEKNLGKGRIKPFGFRNRESRTDREFLKKLMHSLDAKSRTKDILKRAFNGDKVDVSTYEGYVSASRGYDRLKYKLISLQKRFPFISFDGKIFFFKD